MTHHTTQRLDSLLLTFFGDESLSFHSRRLHTFFAAAFADPNDDTDEDQTPSIPNLLHTQNDLLRLLDAADLLYQLMPLTQQSTKPTPTQQLKHVRTLLKDWDDFPSHLHPHEWCNPEIILEEFFTLQPIDEWKNSIYGLLQSAIGEGSPFTSLSEKQAGFIVLLLHRLQDAIWLLHITGRIPSPEEEETPNDDDITQDQQPATINAITPTHAMLKFFFVVSNGKFTRIDHDEILCMVGFDDHVQLHTLTGMHEPKTSIHHIKELLHKEQFVWITEQIAVAVDRYS